MTETNRQRYYDLNAQHADLVRQANEAFEAQDVDAARNFTEQAEALQPERDGLRRLLDQEAQAGPAAPVSHEMRDRAEERADTLRNGGLITFSAAEICAGLGLRISNATTLATGTLVEPTRAGSTIHGGDSPISSIVDQVYVQDLTGCQAIQEPILRTELEGKAAKVTTAAGTARAASDPVFTAAKIQPYEVSVTSFVDRNLANLTPVAYEEKIRTLAMRALRRKVAQLIYNGDGQASPDMYGIKTAKDVAGNALYKTVDLSTIEAGCLDKLVYAYGGDEEIGGNARLYLNKKDLQALGTLRSTDGKRIYEIIPEPGNPNVGRIVDGGLIVPYTIGSALTALTGANATTAAVAHMLYGAPTNYELGLFGAYSIRVDTSVRAVERMNTILGDVMVGGNLIQPDGFVVGSLPKG
ncbi:MAG: phage major capsid protein [Clostridiales bacterium]|nr:phage major capsid protein [Clostridiales bacterium]